MHHSGALVCIGLALLLAAGCSTGGDRLPTEEAVLGTQFDGWADFPSISADGRFVAFATAGNDIAGLSGVRSAGDIVRYDRETGRSLSVINLTSLRDEYATFLNPSLSGDGRFIAFEAVARLPENPYLFEGAGRSHQIFVIDCMTGNATIVSKASGGAQGNGRSVDPVITDDARCITFSSWADNLVRGDTNGVVDVFVHNRTTGTTTRVSVASDGTQANRGSYPSWISGSGRWIAFASGADNLAAGDDNGVEDIFLHDTAGNATTPVSFSPGRTQRVRPSVSPAISNDGCCTVFRSFGNSDVPGTSAAADIFVYDRRSATTRNITNYPPGAVMTGWSRAPAISGDGRYIAFESMAALTTEDGNGMVDVFVYDTVEETTTLISVSSGGIQGDGDSRSPDISADGRFIAFVSEADNLVKGDTNGYADVFVHDRVTGRTTLVSVRNTMPDKN